MKLVAAAIDESRTRPADREVAVLNACGVLFCGRRLVEEGKRTSSHRSSTTIDDRRGLDLHYDRAMAETADATWTLWVFAGPGALPGKPGQTLPLTDLVGELPSGVALLAETVGTPTLLQQLTGEWPAERLARGLDVGKVPRAERDLGRFVAWADAKTPKGSKRALIVLGDVLQAIGQGPKALVPGGDRPPYPSSLTIKKKDEKDANAKTYTSSGSLTNTSKYSDGSQSKTVDEWLASLQEGDTVRFGGADSPTWTRASAAGHYTKSGDSSNGEYWIKPTSGTIEVFKIAPKGYPPNFSILSGGSTISYTQESRGNYKNGAGVVDSMSSWVSKGVAAEGDKITFLDSGGSGTTYTRTATAGRYTRDSDSVTCLIMFTSILIEIGTLTGD